MDTHSTRPRIEALLEHSGWLRGLARQLVGEAEADDLVQETWAAALRRAPGRIASPRPWLAAVARNLARLRARGDANRAHREAQAAREEALPSADEMAGRVETQRRLAELVVALDEPYRTAVWLRYHEGLAASELARRLGVPAGTARWRVKEGLDRIRRELDAGFDGDRSAWVALVAPLAGLRAEEVGTAATVAALFSGAIVMKSLVLVAGAAALALLTVWALRTPGGAGPADTVAVRPSGTAAPDGATNGADSASTIAASAPAGDRDEVVAAAGESGAAAPAIDLGARVSARVLDEEGRPIAGARLVTYDRNRPARSGADGRVLLVLERLELRGHSSVHVSAPGFVARRFDVQLEPSAQVELRDVVLEAGGAIEGVVLDAGGAPVSGAHVAAYPSLEAVERYGLPALLSFDHDERTDVFGRYRLDGVERGRVRVWAQAQGTLRCASKPVVVAAGDVRSGVEVVLERVPDEGVIAGLVVDEAGAPVPWAQVHLRGPGSVAMSTADGEGRFRFEVTDASPRELEARPQNDRDRGARLGAVVPGMGELVLRLGPLPQLELDVRDTRGAPVAGFRAEISTSFDRFTGARSSRGAELDFEGEPGRARTPMPLQPFLLRVSSGRHSPVELGPLHPNRIAGPVRVVLDPLDAISGRVTADGAPLEGAAVSVRALVPRDWTYEKNGFPLLRLEVESEALLTDEHGRFTLAVDLGAAVDRYGPDVELVVRAEREGFAPGESSVLAGGGPVEELALALGLGGSIEGRVLEPADRPAEVRHVAASCGDEEIEVAAVGEDGTFRFERLRPGPWMLRPYAQDQLRGTSTGGRQLPRAEPIAWSCMVVAGATTRFDLELPSERLLVLGRLIAGSEGPRTWSAELVPPPDTDTVTARRYRRVAVDADGSFEVTGFRAGSHRLVLRTGDAVGPDVLVVAPLELGSAEVAWELEVEWGALAGSAASLDSEGREQLWYAWRDDAGSRVLTRLRVDERGEFRTAAAPVGDGLLVRWDPKGLRPEGAARLSPARVESAGTIRVDLE